MFTLMRMLFPFFFAAVLAFDAQPKPYGKMVKLAGHEVHLHCEGSGDVTVLLLHGTPRFSFHFDGNGLRDRQRLCDQTHSCDEKRPTEVRVCCQ